MQNTPYIDPAVSSAPKKHWPVSVTIIVTIVALLVSGGGVYAYEHAQATSKENDPCGDRLAFSDGHPYRHCNA